MINNVRNVQRREFLELLHNAEREMPSLANREQSLFSDNHRWDELMLVWPGEQSTDQGLPSVIVVDDGTEREFLAWAATYLSDFRPFTSYFRVLDKRQFLDLDRHHRKQQNVPVRALLGLILGEAASYTLSNREFRQLTPAACSATCSYALARSVFVSEMALEPELIIAQWHRARKMSNQSPLPLNEVDIMNSWSILFDLYAENSILPRRSSDESASLRVIRAICRRLLSGDDDVDGQVVRELLNEIPGLSDRSMWLGRTREERVAGYEELLSQLANLGGHDSLMTSFALAYFVSRISLGSLEHLRLLVPVAPKHRSVLMWYGLLAGIHPESQLATVGAGLGRRLIRDVQRVAFATARPTCDIALSELHMLSSTDPQLSELITSVPGQLEIEIVAGISTFVRWPNRLDGGGGEISRSFSNSDEARDLFHSLSKSLQEADAMRRRLGDILQLTDRNPGREPPVRRPYSKNRK